MQQHLQGWRRSTRRPLVIHEQNAVAGTTNRWLSSIAVRVCSGITGPFAEARMTEVVGTRCVTSSVVLIMELQSLACFSGARPMRTWSSEVVGAAPLNELLPTTARLVSKGYGDTISVWHQCGERNRSSAELAEKQLLATCVWMLTSMIWLRHMAGRMW